ncbi:hypothetical protein EWH70_21225 [Amycolatopsis suaedae]|uniref:Uncharacterized protein n=1 Tax=Amycolatopsis suaedae TaxID=2510978 RepID=A0A4Q7J4Y0_9PSEU|nr:hypothetical protein EWH70_21225 [Amycolatopsis suaedae]
MSSPKFDLIEGPRQHEEDGRYWAWLIQPHEGVDLNDPNADIPVNWTCGGKPGGGSSPLNPGGDKGKGGKQVKYKPKKGVETGYGLD